MSSDGWLARTDACFSLDPDLMLCRGRQFVPADKPLFGLFADSCPDRWARLLMKRRETILARKEKRKPRQLTGTDILQGVYDEARMGALRFSTEEGDPFLSFDETLATPPWTILRKLEAASCAFEQDDDTLLAYFVRFSNQNPHVFVLFSIILGASKHPVQH